MTYKDIKELSEILNKDYDVKRHLIKAFFLKYSWCIESDFVDNITVYRNSFILPTLSRRQYMSYNEFQEEYAQTFKGNQ